ncbi:hypothetical protein [Yersinia ruckeri]|uniref:hypothetical protein n=1 Tax=Yersinia ruckeri TaxID=29486 RepID=UPI002238CC63|nr:hypothetical protein [Yersinia ruckeri]MCW6568666.1 hypothetical protein [Yersinia ruckeri]
MGINFFTRSNRYYIVQENKAVKTKNAKDQKYQCIASLAARLTRCYQQPGVTPNLPTMINPQPGVTPNLLAMINPQPGVTPNLLAMINPQAGWSDGSRNLINGLAQILSSDENFTYNQKVTLLCSEVLNRYAANQLEGMFRKSISMTKVENMLKKNDLPFDQWITHSSLVDPALLGKLLKDEIIASFPRFTLDECHEMNEDPQKIQQIITKKLSELPYKKIWRYRIFLIPSVIVLKIIIQTPN